MNDIKRAVAIHDISAFGKCSLTLVHPILSSAGVETAVLPTALLSTHTGGFLGYTCCDLSDEMAKISNHWQELGLEFDAIYTGYLGSQRQVDLACEFVEKFAHGNTVVMVDPAMADNGKLYSGLDDKYADAMKKLCLKADIIVPNFTEAAMLLGEKYLPENRTVKYAEKLAEKLRDKYGAMVVLTGVKTAENMVGALCFDGESFVVAAPEIQGHFHGTGDAFAAVLMAGVLNGKSLVDSAQSAVDFTHRCIAATVRSGRDSRYGLCFESELGTLG